MQYNFYFDICALFILATIAITSLSRRRVPAYRQRAYAALYTAMLVATVAERFETVLQLNPSPEQPWYHTAEMICGSMYFLAHLGTAYFYLIYIRAILDIYIEFRSLKDQLLINLGYTICIIMLVVNWFWPVMFYYDENGVYHRGEFILFIYAIALYYISYGLFTMLRYRRLMRIKTRLVATSYVLFSILGIVVQFFIPVVLIENFCNAISITLVYITLQNPSEMVDERLNILNRKAFLEGLELKTTRKHPHATIFVTIDNIRALSSEIGYSQAQAVLKKIAKYLMGAGKAEYRLTTYTYRYSDYCFAVTVHSQDDKKINKLLERIAKRLKEPWNSANMAIHIDGHCFVIKYPDHYKTTAELMNRIDIITEDIAGYRDVIIDLDDLKYNEIKKYRDYDVLARGSLDSKRAVIKFQPILSKVYKINYSADVICFFLDENGKEIDVREHIPDVRVTQALMDTDEYVYRRACRALAFWNAGDKNGKYRAVVGLSQGEISRNDFVRRIKKILKEERAEASWISLKLTETTLATMNSVAERNLKLLGDMKASIIVDKYGSGYGNLDRLLTLPIMQINIDHSILTSAMESEQMKIVAQGIVNLFHDISLFVGASDISCEADKAMAEELGCDFLIGDYMGEPMKDSSYVKFIDAYFDEG
ncbi:EAL domain-containing protein [Butyrivibrio sp. MC2021]|uniref:EAL domain-containing protein n=1 Tax=Butyrivibrio sp. MC2021 TaxID=1408306 RepID=UPI000479DCA5|nr:EAL domain-containing protein [Butyrivibrio sp. MC2021]